MRLTNLLSYSAHFIPLRVRKGSQNVIPLFEGRAAITKGSVVRVLATGALLSLGAILYLNMVQSGEAEDLPLAQSAPKYHQQRAGESIQERLEVMQVLAGIQESRKAVSPSYHQQRAAESIQERLEVQRVRGFILR